MSTTTGPDGQIRPRSTHANAIRVAKILTGDAEEEYQAGLSAPEEGRLIRPKVFAIFEQMQDSLENIPSDSAQPTPETALVNSDSPLIEPESTEPQA